MSQRGPAPQPSRAQALVSGPGLRAGTLLSAEALSVSFGERAALRGVSLSLSAGERLALLGRNGAGKTTLLRVLAGERPPDEGQLWRADGLRLAALSQHPLFALGVTAGALLDQANPFLEAEADLRRLETQLDDPEVLADYTAQLAAFEAEGGFRWPAQRARVAGILDLTRFQEREAATLSGGERTRLALARALLQAPDLLLLDEPTNHLDLRMREWLENFLAGFAGAVVLTSHDRDFLDRVATSERGGRSLWLEDGEATAYAGGYSQARAQRELERRTAGRLHRLATREEARLEAAAGQLDRWGRRSQGVKSRLERSGGTEAPQPERIIRMRLLAGQARARLVLWAEHLSKSYAGRPVLRGAALKLRQGDRVVLMGANGTGKTTLLRLLAGEEYPDPLDTAGTGTPVPPALQVAPGVSVVSLDQTWHGLEPEVGLLAQFEARFGARASALLGRAGFREDDWPKVPTELSGGERARAGLALVSALRSDLLLLDEPTNHLDVEALEALETAVQAYSGAVVIVTHDRRFAREVATRLWVIEDGQLHERAGWQDAALLDPARSLEGDPPPPPPHPGPRPLMLRAETRLLELARELDRPDLGGRDEARLRRERHQVQAELYELYAEVWHAPQYDHELRTGPLRVRAQVMERGAMFWAAGDLSCPHLAWDGETLRWSSLPPAWYGAALLGSALELLFLRCGAGRVTLGDGGPRLTRRRYLELTGRAPVS